MIGRRLVVTLGLAVVPGCAEELGPVRWETARVSGVVTEGSRPVTRGWIEFLPSEGTVGDMRSAPIGPDGRFVVEGVAVGVNRVGIAGADVGTYGGRKVFDRRKFDPLGSPIRRTIPGNPPGPIVIDLFEEFAATLPNRTAGAER